MLAITIGTQLAAAQGRSVLHDNIRKSSLWRRTSVVPGNRRGEAPRHDARVNGPEAPPHRSAAGAPSRLEVAFGTSWAGGYSLGSRDANLVRNQSPSPYPLFTTENDLTHAIGLESRVGWRLFRTVTVEGSASWSRPRLESHVTADAEGAPAVTAIETLSQYTIDGSAVVRLTRWRLGARGVPFVLGGAGYVRQLHERDVFAQSGMQYHAGGGVKYGLAQRDTGFVRDVGLRLDGRLYVRRGGVDLDAARPWRPIGLVSAALELGF
jgi:hypothetical protein